MACKDCIHFEACDFIMRRYTRDCPGLNPDGAGCSIFFDKSRYIELPCKVGDTVWVADKDFNYVEKYTVSEINMYDNGSAVITEVRVYNYFASIKRRGYTSNYFGKQIFLTREEAEKALKEREKHEV